MADRLDLPERHRQSVEALLLEHVPDVEVWAYGSRVNGMSHGGSDLDLVLRGPGLERLGEGYYDLLEAFQESNIPILIQAYDWARLPEGFHREIERDYVVVQERAEQTTPDGWREVALGDLIDIKHGYAFKGAFIDEEPMGDVLLTPGNFAIGGGFQLGRAKYYCGTVPSEFVLSEDDLLVTMTDLSKQADTLGYPAFVPSYRDGRRYLHNQRLGKISLRDPKRTDARFLYYVLCSKGYRDEVLASATGTTVKHTSPERIKRYRFPLPPLPEQRAIAHILGTLDDKIELNHRMNETLEEMARALFKSWFVDFDPVRAKMEGRDRGLPPEIAALFPDRLADSELGLAPEGWEVKPLGEFGEIITGKTPSTKQPEYYGADVPFLRIPDMHGKMYVLGTEVMLSAQGADSQSQKTLPPGSISVSCIATPGLVVLNHRSAQTNQQINSIIPHNQSASNYLYWTCNHLSSDIETGGLAGSVFGNMNKSTFSALPAICPEPSLVSAFDALVSPIHTLILANQKQAHILSTQRDALLPKLVSGEVGAGDWDRLSGGKAP